MCGEARFWEVEFTPAFVEQKSIYLSKIEEAEGPERAHLLPNGGLRVVVWVNPNDTTDPLHGFARWPREYVREVAKRYFWQNEESIRAAGAKHDEV